ncbi:acidPPc domain-containing protein, partial [Haematococcus lacustris]
LPLVARVQQTWRSKLLDILVKAAAVTVTVEFYLIGLPILYWLGAHDGCQLLVGCLALTTWVLESPRDVEYGAPSMHLSLALVMQGTAAHLAACALTTRWGWEQHSPAAWALHAGLGALALAWAALIAWSRLYLGVHTPVDLALGAATGGSVLALWRCLGPCWLAWLKTAAPSQCAAYLLLHGLLLALYPRPKAHTSRSGNEQAIVLLQWLRL